MEGRMIARHWRGWTEPQNADAYEALLKNKVLPGLRDIEGYRGGYVLRSDRPSEVEFVVVNLFDSLEAVKRFAGSDYAVPSLKRGCCCPKLSPWRHTTTCVQTPFSLTGCVLDFLGTSLSQ